MSISAINSVSFSGKRLTKNGNEYDKTNAGKYIGMGVGTAAGAGFGLKVYHEMSPLKRNRSVGHCKVFSVFTRCHFV